MMKTDEFRQHEENLDDIGYMFVCEGYTVIVHSNGDQDVVDIPLFEIEKQLHDKGFFRVHKSVLANIDQVKGIFFNEYGMRIRINGHDLPVARRRKRAFQKALDIRRNL